VVTDGAASDAGLNSALLITQSELFTNDGVDVYGIGVGDQQHMFVSCNFTERSFFLWYAYFLWGALALC
jgi:hypothetical protein